MYKIIIQVFYIILRLGVPWVCRLEHTLVWFLILLAFLWVYQLGHRPSWRPSDHQELTNGEPFPSSCFYCSFSWPFFSQLYQAGIQTISFCWVTLFKLTLFLLSEIVWVGKLMPFSTTTSAALACCGGFLHYTAAIPLYQYHSLFYSKLLDLFIVLVITQVVN